MAVDQLDDERGHRPRHNESASEVRRGEVGPKCDVGDEGGHGYEWFVDNTREQDVGRNEDGAEGAL